MRDGRPAYMRLENPSLGARKESILTDEMMIAFCESRLDWIAKDMEELFDDLREFASSMELDFQEQAAAEFNSREGSFDYVQLQLPFTLAVYSYREEFEIKYDNLRLYLNDRIKTNSWGKSSYAIEIPFVDPWYEGSHSLDVMAMLLNYNSEVDLNGFANWVALHDWAWANIDFFKFAISYACIRNLNTARKWNTRKSVYIVIKKSAIDCVGRSSWQKKELNRVGHWTSSSTDTRVIRYSCFVKRMYLSKLRSWKWLE